MSEQMRREIILGPGQEVVVKAAAQPGGDPLSEVLDAIVAEGHLDIRLERWPGFTDDERWECRTHLAASRWGGQGQEQHREWKFGNHAGETFAATALEAAQARLDQIRLGKSLTWLAFAAPEAE